MFNARTTEDGKPFGQFAGKSRDRACAARQSRHAVAETLMTRRSRTDQAAGHSHSLTSGSRANQWFLNANLADLKRCSRRVQNADSADLERGSRDLTGTADGEPAGHAG